MKYKICNIHRNFKRNKGTIFENFFYAHLVDENNEVVISAGIDYILEEIIKRGFELVDDR